MSTTYATRLARSATRAWLRAGLLACLAVGALAMLPKPAFATDAAEAETLVQQVLDEVITELRGTPKLRADRAALHAFVDAKVLPYFDFRRMSRRVLARHWRAADEAQRDAFVAEFKALLVRTYSTAMAEYSDDEVKLVGTRVRKPGKQVSVRTQLLRRGGPPVPINFEMYNNGDSWKVFDVAVDGISLVINYRGSFDREVRANGLDALVVKMRNGSVEG